MKILFCLLHFGYERNFEPVIRELAARGHQVHVAAERSDRDPAKAIVEAIARDYPNVTSGFLPTREKDQYRDVVQRIRTGFDYLRYLEPTYHGMPGLRMRSEDRVPVGLLRVLDLPGMKSAPGRALVRMTLQQLERATPPSEAIAGYLRAERPDALLITPLIGIVTSSQLDYVAAAKQLGIPSGFCVWSWDNLSSKALLRDLPDRIFVWNETQKREAVELHRVPPQRVVVSGAQCFDRWFDRKPSRTREEFCAYAGLPVDRPYVMYVCSTMVWKSPPEAQFVVRWIRHLRASADPVLRDAAILVRPHPGRLQEWTDVDLSRFGHVVVSGRSGAAGATSAGAARTSAGAAYPIDEDSRADYFDALYHSSAVVGINTSAFIEAGIIGRPVYAILADEFSGTQSGTIHFRYLTEVGGGVAEAGREFEEHTAQLAAALRKESRHEERQRRFLESFVRPRGLDQPATPLFADAVEELARLSFAEASAGKQVRPVRRPRLAGPVLDQLVQFTQYGRGKRLIMTKDEFVAAAVNETPRTPLVEKLRERTRKRFKKVQKQARWAHKRTVNARARFLAAAWKFTGTRS
jgi:hypothetical protein